MYYGALSFLTQWCQSAAVSRHKKLELTEVNNPLNIGYFYQCPCAELLAEHTAEPVGNRTESVLEWVCLDWAGTVPWAALQREKSCLAYSQFQISSSFSPDSDLQAWVPGRPAGSCSMPLEPSPWWSHTPRNLLWQKLSLWVDPPSSVCLCSSLQDMICVHVMFVCSGGDCLTCHHAHRNPSGLGRFLVWKNPKSCQCRESTTNGNGDRRKSLLSLRVWRVFGTHVGTKQIVRLLFHLICVGYKAVGQVQYWQKR